MIIKYLAHVYTGTMEQIKALIRIKMYLKYFNFIVARVCGKITLLTPQG